MPRIAPLPERQARYERIKAMDHEGKDLAEIGKVFGLSRQRVQQIIERPPRKPGPPFNPNKLAELRAKLALWEHRRDVRTKRGQSTEAAELRIASILAEIAFVTSNET